MFTLSGNNNKRLILHSDFVALFYRLKYLIDVLFCKLHYGFGGNRLSTLSKQVSLSEFIIDRYDIIDKMT
jgi:hypothetical protein